MRNFSINHHDCRIIFLDLEFYVPESSRRTKGLSYNPWDPDCKLLGGSFFVANPTKDFESPLDTDSDQIQSFWLWDYDSEKALLIDIFNLLKQANQDAKEGNDGRVSATLCGIGIISSDIPVIFDRSIKKVRDTIKCRSFLFSNRVPCYRCFKLSHTYLQS